MREQELGLAAADAVSGVAGPPSTFDTSGDAERYSLYLVQRDLKRKDAKGDPAFVGLIGVVNASPAGYEFIPHTTSHRRSTKLHPTCAKAIPAWADKRAHAKGYGDLLTYEEFVAAQGGVRA